MKIIQSLWTKPVFHESARKNDGWLERKYFYIASALSCLQFRKFYPDVELFTDTKGRHLLIDKLGLPFTGVSTCLDDLDHCHPDLWFLSKIFTLSKQHEPFVHADMNVFIGEKLALSSRDADIICQNRLQIDNESFQSLLIRTNAYLPGSFHRLREEGWPVYNTGLVGGADLTFYAALYREVINLIDSHPGIDGYVSFIERDPASRFSRINQVDLFNTIIEQYLFTLQVLNSRKEVHTCRQDGRMSDLTGLAVNYRNTSFLQPTHHHKMNIHICNQVESELRRNYPAYYYRILNLLNTGDI